VLHNVVLTSASVRATLAEAPALLLALAALLAAPAAGRGAEHALGVFAALARTQAGPGALLALPSALEPLVALAARPLRQGAAARAPRRAAMATILAIARAGGAPALLALGAKSAPPALKIACSCAFAEHVCKYS